MAERSLSPLINGKSRSVDSARTHTPVSSPATGVKARASTSESRNAISDPVDVNASTKPASMLNRFKLFNSRDSRTSAAVKDVNGGVVSQPASTSEEMSPAPRRQLPTYSKSASGGSQIPSYSVGTFPVDESTQSSGPLRYAGGRPQRQRAPPPPERHISPAAASSLQEPRRSRVLPAGPQTQHAAQPTCSTSQPHSFGFGSESSSSRYPPQRAVRRAAGGGGGSSRGEIFIDQPRGGGAEDVAAAVGYEGGSRSSSSSVPSRAESSTSISSIASSSTTGGGVVAGARRSGLARRIASSSAQPDKRNAKSTAAAAASANGASSRAKSAKPLLSSIPSPATPGSVNRTVSRQLAGGDASMRRQKGPTSTNDDSVSATLAETTSTTGRTAGRGLIPRRNSARTTHLVDRTGEVDGELFASSAGSKLPTVVSSRLAMTPDTPRRSSDAAPVNRTLTAADSSVNPDLTSRPPSRMPQPSLQSAVRRLSTSPPHAASKLSSPPTPSAGDSSDVEQHQRLIAPVDDDRRPSPCVSGSGSVTAPPSPAISGNHHQALMMMTTYRSASVGRPAKEKSNSSISSGFGDESNNSTSDSTDSVIFQPPASTTTSARVPLSNTTQNNALCESSSSAIDSDSPPSETTAASGDVDTLPAVDSAAPAASLQSPAPPAHQTVDHITSLRGTSRRQSDDGAAPVAKAAPAAISPPRDDSESSSAARTNELIDAFDGIKPMQPLVRASIPCCVYEPPSTRRLPTLLATQSAGVSRRLVFSSRPPLGPGVTAPGARGVLSGRGGTRESTASTCGYMSDGDVVRGGGTSSSVVSRAAADRLMSGYTSEGGGGGVTSYARRMQQRFLEGILAVRQSMERAPQFTDDDRSDARFVYI